MCLKGELRAGGTVLLGRSCQLPSCRGAEERARRSARCGFPVRVPLCCCLSGKGRACDTARTPPAPLLQGQHLRDPTNGNTRVRGRCSGSGRTTVGRLFSPLIFPMPAAADTGEMLPSRPLLGTITAPKAACAFERCLFSSSIHLLFSSPAHHLHLGFAQKED